MLGKPTHNRLPPMPGDRDAQFDPHSYPDFPAPEPSTSARLFRINSDHWCPPNPLCEIGCVRNTLWRYSLFMTTLAFRANALRSHWSQRRNLEALIPIEIRLEKGLSMSSALPFVPTHPRLEDGPGPSPAAAWHHLSRPNAGEVLASYQRR